MRSKFRQISTVGPLLSGHPWDFENWPLNRGWPFKVGVNMKLNEILRGLKRG